MFGWLRVLFGREPAPRPRVMLIEDEIRFDDGRGKEDSIRSGDLTAIVIETNDSGPWGDDVIWHLFGREAGRLLSIPQSTNDFPELLVRLQAMPGFDNREVVAAMGSTTLNAFLCWEADETVRPDSAVLQFARFGRGRRQNGAA